MRLYDNKSNQEIEFFIPETYKKIAINCSGGADSSILLYMIIKFLEEHNRTDTKVSILTCANDRKGRWNAKNSTAVINYVIENTKTNLIDTHLSYYRDRQDVKYFHEIESELFLTGKIDLIISGITANPTNDTLVENINNEMIDLKDEALSERDGKNHKIWYTNEEGNWHTPFINVDKKMIAYLYNYYNVEESLLPLTRSCEGHADSTDNFTRPCGKCWWCLERKWAFGKF